MSKKMVAIIDIDTTISHTDHRASLLRKTCVVCGNGKLPTIDACYTCLTETEGKITQESWDMFLHPDVVSLDEPVHNAVRVIKSMRDFDMEFHFVTGRGERLREVTETWLHKHVAWHPERESLVMRGEKHNNVAASVYKEASLKQLIEDKKLHDSSFIFFEDDPWTLKMYAKYGLCVKCPEGWDSFCSEMVYGEEPVWRR